MKKTRYQIDIADFPTKVDFQKIPSFLLTFNHPIAATLKKECLIFCIKKSMLVYS